MSRLVTIGEAARELGVSSKTLRRYEERGLLKPIRTMGGQRRYYLSALRALLASAVEEEEPNDPPPAPSKSLPVTREPSVWDEVEEERASLEALKVRALRDDFLRAQREDAERVERERKARAEAEARTVQEEAQRAQQMRAKQQAETEHRTRLQFELSLAEMRLLAEPKEAHAAIRKALHGLLTVERIPVGTAAHHTSTLIRDEIDSVAAPFRRARDLKSEGLKYAEREIAASDLTFRDRQRLREAVEAELNARVTPEWTPRRAERLVEALLDELWPEEDDE